MKNKLKNTFGSVQFKRGTSQTILTIIIIAIVVAINIVASKLPSTVKNVDISENHIYSIGSVTKDLLNNLNHKVDIIVVAEDDNIDSRIKNILELYDDSSDNVTVEYKDPAMYPSVLTKYDTSANTIVVTCEDTDKTQTISFGDIIQYDEYYYYYYGQYYETEFDGEGQLTTAIDYVASDVTKTIYMLTGHGESEFCTTVSEKISKSNFTTTDLNLLTEGSIPEDCSMLIINQPESDLNENELNSIETYLENNGEIMIILGDKSFGLTNFDSLMALYGLSAIDAYVGDTNRYNQYDNSYFSCFPDYSSEEITSEFDNQSELVLVQNSYAVGTEDTEEVTFDKFLVTSSGGILYAANDTESIDYGTYNYAVKATKSTDDSESNMIVYACASIIDEQLLYSYSGVKNTDVLMNSITSVFDDVSNISIDPVSLQTEENTIANPRPVSMIFIAVIPVVAIVFGLVHWLKRRKY